MDNNNLKNTEEGQVLNDIKQTMNGIADDVRSIKGSMDAFMGYIGDLQKERRRTSDGITLTRKQVLDFLNVSVSTLANWRNLGLIEYRKTNQRNIVYDYKQLEEALKSGKLVGRYFDPDLALRRMHKWYDGTYEVQYLNNNFMKD